VDKTSFFILNVFLNSFLAFFTAAFLIETVIFIFRMKQGRTSSLLRMIPILKLPLDLCFYDFSRWAYIQGINPLHCEEGTRTLSVLLGWTQPSAHWLHLPLSSAIQFTIPGDLTFTISDVIGYMMNPNHLKLFASSLVFLSLCFFIRKLVTYHRCIKTIHLLKVYATPMTKKICNPYLLARIKKENYLTHLTQKRVESFF